MSANLSIKAVPDELLEKLRQRAQKNHRSLQGELMTILEMSLEETSALAPAEALKRLRKVGLKTRSESTAITRENRNRK